MSSISIAKLRYLTSGNDTFNGVGNDEDEVYGRAGNDTIHGNNGNDSLHGDEGNDKLYGDAGNDYIYGDDGNDAINGGIGDDWIYGGDGIDTLYGGAGDDHVYVGNSGSFNDESDNTAYGGDGSDNVDGGAASDKLYGDAGNDYIDGWQGNDFLFGGAGNDSLDGSFGNDQLDGGIGADNMSGGWGNDTYFYDNVGDVIVEGGNSDGVDTVQSFNGFSLANGNIFQGDIENGQLRGSGNFNLGGNVLNNTLTGNGGANIVSGGAGNDVINGFTGNDTLTGGAGSDRFLFNTTPNASTNLDKITDFNVPQDAIWLDNAAFKALGNPALLSAAQFHIGTGAADALDRIVYNSATGALYYDADGSGAGAAIQFATLSKGLAMTNADFLIV